MRGHVRSSGYMAAMAAATGAQVEAVDFSPTMVDAATRNDVRIDLLESSPLLPRLKPSGP
jgi:protein-L-isoaspartate O-methyltransferase